MQIGMLLAAAFRRIRRLRQQDPRLAFGRVDTARYSGSIFELRVYTKGLQVDKAHELLAK